MSKLLFTKEYVISVANCVEQVSLIDPHDSTLIVIPAPYLSIEVIVFQLTSTKEIHVSCSGATYIFTKPVVQRDDFVEESLLKMVKVFRLPTTVLAELEKALLDFIEYTKANG